VSCVEGVGGGEHPIAACSHLVTQTHSFCREEILCQNPNNYQRMVQKSILGASVLTRYNNRTYRIDDIDWNKTPNSTFATRGDEMVSMMI
jgi:aubergine-like protein